jgi:small-conductance mechanosensitive channel
MIEAHIEDITRVIQLAIAPVFLLTAIGTILNILMGRLARAVDRRRILEEHMRDYVDVARDDGNRELNHLHRRIRLVMWAVALSVLAALLVCLLIGTAFAGAFIAVDLTRPVAILFIAAVLALTFCLLIFLREIAIAAMSARQTLRPQSLRDDFRNATAAAKYPIASTASSNASPADKPESV